MVHANSAFAVVSFEVKKASGNLCPHIPHNCNRVRLLVTRTVGYEATKVAADDAVPGRTLSLVKLYVVLGTSISMFRIADMNTVSSVQCAIRVATNRSLDMLGNVLLCISMCRLPMPLHVLRTFSIVNFAIAS